MFVRKRYLYRIITGFIVLVFGLSILSFAHTPVAHAAQITNRSLTLQSVGVVGGSDPGGVVDHLFTFDLASTTAIQSVMFQYCTIADGTCTLPTGLVTTAATVGTGTSSFFSGFTITNTTNGSPYISSATAVTPVAATPYTVQLDSVTNPTATNTTFYVRITTYATANATGTVTDSGNVAASTANPITLTGTMPESLIFCTGATVSTTSGIPDCTTATAGNVTFNQLFSPTATATATSQMAASTNANHGYAITVNGTTLTSGTNSITAMTTATTSIIGSPQFGMNLEVNTTPAVGTALTPTSGTTAGSNYTGLPLAGYNTANTFKFNTGDTVANSSSTGTNGPTDAQIYTVSYIVNVPGNQPAGTYTTTLTYICTATY